MNEYSKIPEVEKQQLLHFLEYNLTWEQRAKLMNQLPQAYNHLIGQEIVKVIRVSDGTEVYDGSEVGQ